MTIKRLPDEPKTPRSSVHRSAKDERLQVRVPAEHIELARRAAALEGTTVSDFARRAVEQRARDTLERHRPDPTRITLDPVAFDAFLAACDAPAPPNETLRETIKTSLAFDVE